MRFEIKSLVLVLLATFACATRVWGAAEAAEGSNTVALAKPAADSTLNGIAPEPGLLPTPGVIDSPHTNQNSQLKEFQVQLELARKQRQEKSAAAAAKTLAALLQKSPPTELTRPALFELALAEQDDGQALKAQHVLAQYLSLYPNDPSIPEVLLRQGLLYRQMGVTDLAISKFYAVMSTALKLKLDQMDYYKKLVLLAQVEIADTYYLEGKYTESSDFFTRLLKTGAEQLDKPQIEFKLIRSLASLTNHTETIARARSFLDNHADSADVPEVRFLLAFTLKKTGRNQESMKQVLLLLQSQQENLHNDPQTWAYWQRRAGNEIANQLYKENDFVNALEIYRSLSDLDKSAAWQLPVWYQTALVYEQLQQWQKATELYQRIQDRRKELPEKEATPGLLSVFDMAGWRKDYLAWMQKVKATSLVLERDASTKDPTVDAVAPR